MRKYLIWSAILFVGILVGSVVGTVSYPYVKSAYKSAEKSIQLKLAELKAESKAKAEQPAVEGVYPEPTIADTHPSSNEVETSKSNGWTITYLPGSDLDRGDGSTFRDTFDAWNFRKIAPELWNTFPNVPNPKVSEFRVVNGNQVPDGLEYAMDESNFCQQLGGEGCRVPVAAMHYLLFTGDYDIPGIGECHETNGKGCALVIFNVGNVSADFTGVFQQGFRLHARYWNGDKLDMATWALTSHTANVMLNMNSTLNPADIQNAGANCSVPDGCEGVNVRVVFTSGNETLVKLETTVER